MSHGRFIAIRLQGYVKKESWNAISRRISEAIERERLVRMMVVADDPWLPQPRSIWQGLSVTWQHGEAIERIAFVGGWGAGARALATELFSRSVVRVFPKGQSAEAWIWLHQDDPGAYCAVPKGVV
jgi:hypothetical protein